MFRMLQLDMPSGDFGHIEFLTMKNKQYAV